MTTIEFLRNQIIESRTFVNRLIGELPDDLWYTIPENTDSNFAWQIGHLLLSQNFHIFSCSLGRNPKVFEKVPVQDYLKVFNGLGSMHRSVTKDLAPPSRLRKEFDFVHELCIESLCGLPDEILGEKLEPIPFKHPIAKNKYDAISWSFKHEMWHAAEMEQIKITLNHQTKWIE